MMPEEHTPPFGANVASGDDLNIAHRFARQRRSHTRAAEGAPTRKCTLCCELAGMPTSRTSRPRTTRNQKPQRRFSTSDEHNVLPVSDCLVAIAIRVVHPHEAETSLEEEVDPAPLCRGEHLLKRVL